DFPTEAFRPEYLRHGGLLVLPRWALANTSPGRQQGKGSRRQPATGAVALRSGMLGSCTDWRVSDAHAARRGGSRLARGRRTRPSHDQHRAAGPAPWQWPAGPVPRKPERESHRPRLGIESLSATWVEVRRGLDQQPVRAVGLTVQQQLDDQSLHDAGATRGAAVSADDAAGLVNCFGCR